MSRPTKLNKETQAKICQAIQLGATYELAAQYGGVSYECFNKWRKRAEAELKRRLSPGVKPGTKKWDAEELYVQFFQAIKDAEGKAVVGWLAKIEKAANDGNWAAAAWKLERRYPKNYGKQLNQRVRQMQTTIDLKDLNDEQLVRIANGEDPYDVLQNK